MPGVVKSKAMQKTTIKTLAALTNRMYAEESTHFNDTRTNAWTGWKECLAYVPTTNPLHVLDVGCGNGRFGAFLRENISVNREIEYVGIDTNLELLNFAQESLKKNQHLSATFVQLDLIERMLAEKPVFQSNR